jgi:hypothetical protein
MAVASEATHFWVVKVEARIEVIEFIKLPAGKAGSSNVILKNAYY